MPDLAQGGFRFSIHQRSAPGQSDVNTNLPGHHPQGCKTFQPGIFNPSFNPGFSSLSFSTPEFMVEESWVKKRENSVMKKTWVSKLFFSKVLGWKSLGLNKYELKEVRDWKIPGWKSQGWKSLGSKIPGLKCPATTPTPKLMCMNSKLKTKDGNPMDLRLPGIAGRLKEMDARELASFTALASNNEEKSRRQATER